MTCDYYQMLGVARDATHAQIKRAYRALALQCHPDRNCESPEAEARFKQAAEAYEVLSDRTRRALYDQYGRAGVRRNGVNPHDINDIFAEFGDIFGDIFGFGNCSNKSKSAARGEDLRYDLSLSFEEAVFGTSKVIEIPRREECDKCEGSGAGPASASITCPTCEGSGQNQHRQGFFTLSSTCSTCEGSGEQVDAPCATCTGAGFLKERREVTVKIPAGVGSQTKLRLRGEGKAAFGDAAPGDLFVVLHVEPNEFFEREGVTLRHYADISFIDAALGCQIEVPTLGEPVTVSFPPGTQYGDTHILKNQGIGQIGSDRRGDLIISARLKTPDVLNDEQRRLLEDFARTLAEDSTAQDASAEDVEASTAQAHFSDQTA